MTFDCSPTTLIPSAKGREKSLCYNHYFLVGHRPFDQPHATRPLTATPGFTRFIKVVDGDVWKGWHFKKGEGFKDDRLVERETLNPMIERG